MGYVILLSDNNLDFLETRAEFLEIAGYQVIKAATLEETQNALEQKRIHLAILDIRMVDDNDPSDQSGIALAQKTIGDGIPKLILTDYATIDLVKRALSPTKNGKAAAAGFIMKVEGPEAMLKAVKETLDTAVPIHWKLDIDFNPRGQQTAPGLVALIEPDLPPELLADRVEELNDLFRKTFLREESITIDQLLWHHQDHLFLTLSAYSQGREENFFVTCGLKERIKREREKIKEFIPKTRGTGGLNIHQEIRTPHYGLMISSFYLDEEEGEDIRPFSQFYGNHTDKQVRAALEKLFQEGLKPWLQQSSEGSHILSLTSWYRENYDIRLEDVTPERWQGLLSRLSQECRRSGLPEIRFSPKGLDLCFLNGKSLFIIDPLPGFQLDSLGLAGPFPIGFSLGGLDIETIMTDRAGNCWLSEFCQTGPGPIWHDWASMEISLRFVTNESSNAQELYDMERRLFQATRLGEQVPVDDVDPDLRKLAGSIQAVRGQASQFFQEGLQPYLACLAFLCLKEILVSANNGQHRDEEETLKQLHRVILLSLACEKLEKLKNRQAENGALQPEDPAAAGLVVDESNHCVTINGREISLSPREYDLLIYLYHRLGELCKRADILRAVFQIQTPIHDEEENLLNTNIGRLRAKIEPDSNRPVYLETVRGQGFRLTIKPQ